MSTFLSALRTPGTILLDDAGPYGASARCLLFTEPRRLIIAHKPADVQPALAKADAALRQGLHVAGYVAYEAGHAFLPLPNGPLPDEPLVWLGVYEAPEVFTAQQVAYHLQDTAPFAATAPSVALDEASYSTQIDAIHRLIREGEVYQINFTMPLRLHVTGDAAGLYAALRQHQAASYGAYLHTGPRTVLSLSPELFFRRRDRHVETRPMKGTIQRGATPHADAALQASLQADAKSQAENVMIVDLLRNDLSMLCEPGSVRVPQLFTAETYPTLIQMTSTVEGTLRPDVPFSALFEALFPCGSVTGAPKLRAMSHIQALEGRPRGVYCGAIGYASPDQEAVFNVAIRTLVLDQHDAQVGIGSGIVWDSVAADEYAECLLKARFLTDLAEEDFQLIETMRAEQGAIPLLNAHLRRLSASAEALGFAFDEATVRTLIRTHVDEEPDPQRVRLLLHRDGRATVQATALDPGAFREPVTLVVAPEPVHPHDLFLRHKTTRRTVYEAAYAWARNQGADEALLLTPNGTLTEGSRSNVFIRRGSTLLTPPLSDGLLGGVYRHHLLSTHPDAHEAPLTLADLHEAEAVLVCNAVWGLREARLMPVQPRAEAPEHAQQSA